MSWKPVFKLDNKWCENAQRFATKDEAYASAESRFMRWTAPEAFDAHESEDPVNYRWDNGLGDVSINHKEVTA
jgi:hypothetical protein